MRCSDRAAADIVSRSVNSRVMCEPDALLLISLHLLSSSNVIIKLLNAVDSSHDVHFDYCIAVVTATSLIN